MQELVNSLNKRKLLTFIILLVFVFIAFLFDYNFQITTPTYFEGKYNIHFSNGLIIYKIFELIIIYYFLFHRYLIQLKTITYTAKDYPKLKKHTSLLLFLIPQGNTIFGIIAYKFSGSILYFLLFSFIAFVTLILVQPSKLLR